MGWVARGQRATTKKMGPCALRAWTAASTARTFLQRRGETARVFTCMCVCVIQFVSQWVMKELYRAVTSTAATAAAAVRPADDFAHVLTASLAVMHFLNSGGWKLLLLTCSPRSTLTVFPRLQAQPIQSVSVILCPSHRLYIECLPFFSLLPLQDNNSSPISLLIQDDSGAGTVNNATMWRVQCLLMSTPPRLLTQRPVQSFLISPSDELCHAFPSGSFENRTCLVAHWAVSSCHHFHFLRESIYIMSQIWKWRDHPWENKKVVFIDTKRCSLSPPPSVSNKKIIIIK